MCGRRGCSDLGFWISDCGSWRAGALVGDLKPARWDSIRLPPSAGIDPSAWLTGTVAGCLERRISLFELSHRIGSVENCERAGREYLRRTDRFGTYLADLSKPASWLRVASAGSTVTDMVVAVAMLVLYVAATGVVIWLAGWVWLAALILPFIWAWQSDLGPFRGLMHARRLRRSLNDRRCCDCGYSLEGAVPGIPIGTAGVNVGPRACPECGCAWPLVPPAIEVRDE